RVSPDYQFVLRAAGRGAGMPVYSRYAVAVYGEKALAAKEFECVLGFTPREILNIEKTGNTLLIKDDGTEIYIFDEKERKIKDRIISFPARTAGAGGSEAKDSVTAAAVSVDEKIIALALDGNKSVEILSGENFQHLLSAAVEPAVQETIMGLRFDDKNNLYITGSDPAKKTSALYLCRANLSYSKIEKISGFSLEADSQSESHGAGLFTYYNRRSGSVFKIDAATASSGLIFNEAPQQAGETSSAAEGWDAHGRAKQLIALNDYTALIRSDRKKIKIFSSISGAVTKEIEIANLNGAETACAKAGLEYAFIASRGGGHFWLLNSADLRLVEGGALEGMTELTAASIGR
ncbi:MAG TPA: hypothetical protein DC017_04945, partial [Candidatus Wallbacteria bacterium]|nr:hypothetical protein [Candidatus Wallbacteria bacterium]